MMGLTRAENACLAFIQAYHVREGVMPSRREIAAGLAYKSTARVSGLVDALVERGRLHRVPNRARALALVSSVQCPNCHHEFEPASPGRVPAGEARGPAPQPEAARATSFQRSDA